MHRMLDMEKELRKHVRRKIKQGEITITQLANAVDCTRQTIYNFLDPACPVGISLKMADAIRKECGIIVVYSA